MDYVAVGVAGRSETWKKHNWKIGGKEVRGRGMCTDLYEWARTVKMPVSRMMFTR